MIDIVTIVFENELPILRVQAQSLQIYCQLIGIKNIFVVINDEPQVADQIDINWWGRLQDLVRILHRDQLADYFVEDGWVSQQALKILASACSDNDYTMILDAKTIPVKPVTLDLLLPGGKPAGGTHPVPEVFAPSARLVGELFGVEIKYNGGSSGVPFLFHVETIKQMLLEIKSRTGQDFARWFQTQGMVTEYLLYVGYNLLLHGSQDKVYSMSHPYEVANLCRNQIHMIDQRLDAMHKKNNLTVSVHRFAWERMSAEQRLRYKDLLVSRGLDTAKDI
jgi:hypothetical protein